MNELITKLALAEEVKVRKRTRWNCSSLIIKKPIDEVSDYSMNLIGNNSKTFTSKKISEIRKDVIDLFKKHPELEISVICRDIEPVLVAPSEAADVTGA